MQNEKCKMKDNDKEVLGYGFRLDSLKKRRKFIDNYREWKLIHTAPMLNMVFYSAKLSSGAYIIATESTYEEYGNKIQNCVRYSIIMPEGDKFPNSEYYRFYSPGGCSVTMLMEYFKFYGKELEYIGSCGEERCLQDGEETGNLSAVDKNIIREMGECSLKVRQVATRMHYSSGGVLYHIKKIKKCTGLDARKFADLVKLLERV